jgi:hypothetical protein
LKERNSGGPKPNWSTLTAFAGVRTNVMAKLHGGNFTYQYDLLKEGTRTGAKAHRQEPDQPGGPLALVRWKAYRRLDAAPGQRQ